MLTEFTLQLKDYFYYLKFEKGASANTLASYKIDLNVYLKYVEDNEIKSIDDVNINLLDNFFIELNSLGLSNNSRNRYLSAIRDFHKYLLSEEIISNDVASLVELPSTERKIPDILSVEDIDRLVSIININEPVGVRDRAMIEVLYSCGLRVSELINLTIRDVNIDEEVLKVLGKGSKERLVPIGSTANYWLSKYIKEARNYFIKDINYSIIFLNQKGKKITRMGIWWLIDNYAKNINLPVQVHPHIFRHSFATHLIEGGADLRVVQELLGHSSVNTTQIYTHIDNFYLKEAHRQYHPRAKIK